MSLNILGFGPHLLIDTIAQLSDSREFITLVGTEIEASDAEIYQQLSSKIEEMKHNLNLDVNAQFLILTPQFGDRFSTIALSIPHAELYLLSGINVELLSLLKTHRDIQAMFNEGHILKAMPQKHEIETLKTPKPNLVAAKWLIYQLAEKLCEGGRNGILLHSQCLREEGEDSNIDTSMLETDFSQYL